MAANILILSILIMNYHHGICHNAINLKKETPKTYKKETPMLQKRNIQDILKWYGTIP